MGVLRLFLRYMRSEVLVLPSRVVAVLFCIALFIIPLVVNTSYILRIIALAAIYAIFAASWDMLAGFVGQVCFGHALFFGVAGYVSALLNLRAGLPPPLTIPLGALAAVLVGLLVGFPSLRLKGSYLALATMAFPIMLSGIVFVFKDYTGGELGLSGLADLAGSRLSECYLAVVVMLVAGFIMWKITDSNIGIIFHAIREDEIAVRASGINTIKYKLLAFCLSGFFAGLAGGMYAHLLGIAGPSMLAVFMSFQVIIWTIFGGIATIYGAIAGVFILFPIMEFLRITSQIRVLAFAAIVLLVLRFMPEGVIHRVRDKLERECPRCKVRNAFTRKECRVCCADLR